MLRSILLRHIVIFREAPGSASAYALYGFSVPTIETQKSGMAIPPVVLWLLAKKNPGCTLIYATHLLLFPVKTSPITIFAY